MSLSIEVQTAISKLKAYILSIIYSKEEIDSMLESKMDKTDLSLNMSLNENGELLFITTNNNIESENIDFDYNTGILEISIKEEGEYLYGYSFDSNLNSKNEYRERFYKTGIQGYNKSFSFDFKISNTNRVKLVCFIDEDGNQQYYPEGHWGLGKADEYGDWEIALDYPNINSNQWYHATIYRYDMKNIGLEIDGQLIQKTLRNSPMFNQFCFGAYGFSNEYVIIKNIQEAV